MVDPKMIGQKLIMKQNFKRFTKCNTMNKIKYLHLL